MTHAQSASQTVVWPGPVLTLHACEAKARAVTIGASRTTETIANAVNLDVFRTFIGISS